MKMSMNVSVCAFWMCVHVFVCQCVYVCVRVGSSYLATFDYAGDAQLLDAIPYVLQL